jgi:hypothetical protein
MGIRRGTMAFRRECVVMYVVDMSPWLMALRLPEWQGMHASQAYGSEVSHYHAMAFEASLSSASDTMYGFSAWSANSASRTTPGHVASWASDVPLKSIQGPR